MPIIIDANRASEFSVPIEPTAFLILKSAAKRDAKVAVGGKLLKELAKTPLSALLVEWGRLGCLIRVGNKEIESEELSINSKSPVSNDVHVLALAILSKSRLLYTEDENLIKDFKNDKIIFPSGKVLKRKTPPGSVGALLNLHAG